MLSALSLLSLSLSALIQSSLPDVVLLSIFSHSRWHDHIFSASGPRGEMLLSPYFSSECPREPWLAWSRPLAALLATFLYHQWLAQAGWLSAPVTRRWACDGMIGSPQQSHGGTCPKGAGCQDTETKQQSVLLLKSSLGSQPKGSYFSVSKLTHVIWPGHRLRENSIRSTLRCTHRGTADLGWSQIIFIIFKQHHFWGF